MKKVFIVPGYQASPDQHWFPWLFEKIKNEGAECDFIRISSATQPDFNVWKTAIQQQLTSLNQDTIIVAHSLGCMSVLDYLSHSNDGHQLKALFCISGFYDDLTTLPELNGFIKQAKIQDAKVRHSTQQRYVFLSSNDQVVPAPLTIRFGHLINAQMIEVKDAGHFMQEDGFHEFPQLWDRLKLLLVS